MPSLGKGGAEKVVSYIASSLSKMEDYKVSILLLNSEDNTYISSLPSNIDIFYLNIKGKFYYKVFKIVKEIIKLKPQICFLGLDALNLIISPFIFIFKLYGIKLIVRETNVLSLRWEKWKFKGLFKICYKLFYNQYPVIICQSDDMVTDLRNNWGIKKPHIHKINNPIDTYKVNKESCEPPCISINEPYFVSVGRLHPQKGYIRLINNVNKLIKDNLFPYKLYILGEGIQREALQNLISANGLENQIILLGHIDNPYPIIKNAKGFFLSSDYEGFPNVLLEANALGIPIMANKCQGGINEIIINGVNGLSCDFSDYSEFQSTFKNFIAYSFSNEKIIEINKSRFDLPTILPQYIKIFQ